MSQPEPKSVFETPHDADEEARKDAIALAQLAAGQGVPHERVIDWLLKRAKGEKAPIPTA